LTTRDTDTPPPPTDAIEDYGVTSGSVSAMVKKLAGLGLASHEPYHGVTLTPAGERIALEVLRHHRLLETLLAREFGMSWDQVHEEAEVLEHHLSEHFAELIAEKLGDPTHDPHGDPIPNRELEVESSDSRSLESLEAGDAGTLVRVSDSDADMLRYLFERGIATGQHLEVIEKQPFDGPLIVRFNERVETLPRVLARAIRIELEEGGR
jgi:DtxR family Mn-dependent transcriptional regulator